MTRWLRGSLGVCMALVALGWATPASAGPCAPLDLVCQAGQTTGTVEQTAGTAGTTVGDATGTVTGGIDPIVHHVKDTLGGILRPPPPPGDGGGSNGGGSTSGDGAGPGRGGAAGTGGGGARGGGLGSPSAIAHPSGSTTRVGPTIGDPPSSDLDPRLPSRADRVAAFVHDVQPGVAALVLVLGLAFAFVLIQDRVDRRDPKLRLAPIESDIAEFV